MTRRARRCKRCGRLYRDKLFTTERYIAANHWAAKGVAKVTLEEKRTWHRKFLATDHPEMVECVRCDSMVEFA